MDHIPQKGYVIVLFDDGTNEEIARRDSLSRDDAEKYRQDYYLKHGRKRRITQIVLCDNYYTFVKRYVYSD